MVRKDLAKRDQELKVMGCLPAMREVALKSPVG